MYFKHLSLVLLLVLSMGSARAQLAINDFEVHFPLGSAQINPDYDNNEIAINDIISFLNYANSNDSLKVQGVTFFGTASPEGSYQINNRLAVERRQAVENLLQSRIFIPDTLISRVDNYISWRSLAEWVSQSDIAQRDSVLEILAQAPRLVSYDKGGSIDARIPELMKLDGGRVWDDLQAKYFADLRVAGVAVTTFRNPPLSDGMPTTLPAPRTETPVVRVVHDTVYVAETRPVKPWSGYVPRLTVKTNAVGWAMAIANLGLEVDLCEHLSLSVPFYYSCLDYFKQTIKFRVLAVQPELRVWTTPRNDGFFIGAHFGMAYYNFALNGKYRFQDHNEDTPALGGGIALGYRLPISRNKLWKMEFSVGGGVYKIYYDKYLNTGSTRRGELIGSKKKTFIGVDQVSVSFSYSINLKKGGAK